jgi:hypothetical protein
LPTPASPTIVKSWQRCSARALPNLVDRNKLLLAADKARLVAVLRRLEHGAQPVGLHRLRLPLQRKRFKRVDFDGPTQELERRPANQHLSRLRGLL